MSILIKKRKLNYWTKILKSNQCKLNKVMYDIMYDLHSRDLYASQLIKCIKETLENNGMNIIWLNQDPTLNTNAMFTSACDMFKQLWHSRIMDDENMCIYKLYKNVHCCEMYTNQLFQFRTGSSRLLSNTNRAMGTHRPTLAADINICTACDKPVFAVEFHFIFGCDKLKDIRAKYIPRHHTLRPSIHTVTKQ